MPYTFNPITTSLELTTKPSSLVTVPNISSLRTTKIDKSTTSVYVLGYYTENDGGGGWFNVDRVDTTSIDDSGYTIVSTISTLRYKRHNTTGTINVREFGAKGDGVNEDQIAIQRALDYMVILPKLIFPRGTYLIGETMLLPTSTLFDAYQISGEGGAVLQAKASTALSIFSRPAATLAISEAMLSVAFIISNLTFLGDNATAGQKGLFLTSTYNSIIEKCHFRRLDIGCEMIFCLNALVLSCRATQCLTDSFIAGDGVNYFGGESASNHLTFSKCRVFGKSTSLRQFYIYRCNGVRLLDCICEGAGGQYLIYWDRQGKNTVKQLSVINTHFETTATLALMRIVDLQGGTAQLTGMRTQQSNQLLLHFDGPTSRVLCTAWEQFPPGTSLKNEGTSLWLFRACQANGSDAAWWPEGLPLNYSDENAIPSPSEVVPTKTVTATNNYRVTTPVLRLDSSTRTELSGAKMQVFTNNVEFTGAIGTSFGDINTKLLTNAVVKQTFDPGSIPPGEIVATVVPFPLHTSVSHNWSWRATHNGIKALNIILSATAQGNGNVRVIFYNPTMLPIVVPSDILMVHGMRM